MKKTINVALLQISSFSFDQKANMEKGVNFCKKAKKMGADIILFPEMWNIGYTSYDKKFLKSNKSPINPQQANKIKEWQRNAISSKSNFIRYYKALAKELDVAIAMTYLETSSRTPRNTISIIDRYGKIVLTYAKVHTCDFSLEAACMPGEEFFVCDLDTSKGRVKIGAMICFDREFPESARILMLKGAEIILVPNACELEQNRIAQVRTRAYENMMGIAVANYPAPFANGHSIAFDGIAFNKKGSRDHLILEAPGKEGIYIAKFDLNATREYRQRESWGDAYRKPSCYKVLCENKPKSNFKRKDARR